MPRKCKNGPGYRVATYEYDSPGRIYKPIFCRRETAQKRAREIERKGASRGITAMVVPVGWQFRRR